MTFQIGDRVHIVDVGDWGDGVITGIAKKYYTVKTDKGIILEIMAESMKLLPEKVRFT